MTTGDLIIQRPGRIVLRIAREALGVSPRARAVTAGSAVFVLDADSAGLRIVREFSEDDGQLVEESALEPWEQSLMALCLFDVPTEAAVGVARLS